MPEIVKYLAVLDNSERDKLLLRFDVQNTDRKYSDSPCETKSRDDMCEKPVSELTDEEIQRKIMLISLKQKKKLT